MAVQPISHQPPTLARSPRLDAAMQAIGAWTIEYWALLITVFLGVIVLAAFSVPVLTYLGLNSLAKPLFFTLHLICAQVPSHSFTILGHQLGMCARNLSIYGSMFIGGIVFVASKKRLPGIPWWVWLLMILPMAFDGLTQMFGLRESTWELRVLTGVLFGAGNMWFALPFIQRALMETSLLTDALSSPAYPAQYGAMSAPISAPALPLAFSRPTASLQTPLPVLPASLEETALPLAWLAPASQPREQGPDKQRDASLQLTGADE